MNLQYTFTSPIVRDIMAIEAARQTVRLTVLPPQVAERLRQDARLRSTHYSTRIEGNRLTLDEASQAVLAGERFPAASGTSARCRTITGPCSGWRKGRTTYTHQRRPDPPAARASLHLPACRPTPYRDGQNAIRDAATGAVILPPGAADVPALMAAW